MKSKEGQARFLATLSRTPLISSEARHQYVKPGG
jgi:hypothetical protein